MVVMDILGLLGKLTMAVARTKGFNEAAGGGGGILSIFS